MIPLLPILIGAVSMAPPPSVVPMPPDAMEPVASGVCQRADDVSVIVLGPLALIAVVLAKGLVERATGNQSHGGAGTQTGLVKAGWYLTLITVGALALWKGREFLALFLC